MNDVRRGDRVKNATKSGTVFETTDKNIYVQWDCGGPIARIPRNSPQSRELEK